jgi:hypothetical protein
MESLAVSVKKKLNKKMSIIYTFIQSKPNEQLPQKQFRSRTGPSFDRAAFDKFPVHELVQHDSKQYN